MEGSLEFGAWVYEHDWRMSGVEGRRSKAGGMELLREEGV